MTYLAQWLGGQNKKPPDGEAGQPYPIAFMVLGHQNWPPGGVLSYPHVRTLEPRLSSIRRGSFY